MCIYIYNSAYNCWLISAGVCNYLSRVYGVQRPLSHLLEICHIVHFTLRHKRKTNLYAYEHSCVKSMFWLPRECNELADWLAKIAAEIQLSSSWKASLNTHGINDLFSIGLSDIKWDQNCPGFLVGKELVWVGVGSEDVLTFEEELVWVGVGFVWEHIGKFKIVGKDYC